MKLGIVLSRPVKIVLGFLWGLHYVCRLLLVGWPNIFTILILPIHKHRRSFHLLIASTVSFRRVLKFLSYRYFTCSVRVMPGYFVIFVSIMKCVVSVILYQATLLTLFISYRSSLVEFWGSFMYTIISPTKSNTLNSSFLIWIPLISSCYLIALDRTSSSILNRDWAALSCPWF